MSQHNLPELLSDFNRYFTSSNGVDVPARVSVPRDEWRALFAALSSHGAGEAVLYVSQGQLDGLLAGTLPGCQNLDAECGVYLPVRPVAGGNFTAPLYARPQAAQPARVVEPWPPEVWPREACPLTQAIQRLNSTTYQLTKDECIEVLKTLRSELASPPAAPTPSQQADHSPDGGNMVAQQAGEVTELRAALWHVKNTAKSLADAQVIALEALAAFEAKKAGA